MKGLTGSLPGAFGATAILAGRKGTRLLLSDLPSLGDAVPMSGPGSKTMTPGLVSALVSL